MRAVMLLGERRGRAIHKMSCPRKRASSSHHTINKVAIVPGTKPGSYWIIRFRG
jgi:hypothetical protein